MPTIAAHHPTAQSLPGEPAKSSGFGRSKGHLLLKEHLPQRSSASSTTAARPCSLRTSPPPALLRLPQGQAGSRPSLPAGCVCWSCCLPAPAQPVRCAAEAEGTRRGTTGTGAAGTHSPRVQGCSRGVPGAPRTWPPWDTVAKHRAATQASAGYGEPGSALDPGGISAPIPAWGSIPSSRGGLQVKLHLS